MIRTATQALAFVRKHRVVPMTPAGDLPSFVVAVAGGPIRGSWWGHPKGALIYDLANTLLDSPEVRSVRLVAKKNTFLHRSLWPAFYRIVTDPGWRRPLIRDLTSLERRLLEAAEKAGELRLEGWANRENVPSKVLKKAKDGLLTRLLVDGYNVHTDSGSHATVLQSWKRWAAADVRRAAKTLSFNEAAEELLQSSGVDLKA